MLSANTIADMNRAAARDAAKLHRHPFVVEQGDLDKWKADLTSGRAPRLPFPLLGDGEVAGWVADPGDNTDSEGDLFVDKSGYGQEGEPALTLRGLLGKLQVGKGYGLHSEGQFQIYVRQYRKADPAPKKSKTRKYADPEGTEVQTDKLRDLLRLG